MLFVLLCHSSAQADEYIYVSVSSERCNTVCSFLMAFVPAQTPFPFPYTNPGGDGGSVLVVRHGERMDEVMSKKKWQKRCLKIWKDHYKDISKHLFFSRCVDPPLTDAGMKHARIVAASLAREIANAPEKPRVIFCSKLLRCVMTAVEVAEVLSLPICVSEGFSLTAKAIECSRDDFSFLSFDEIRYFFPTVEWIDGDTNIFPDCRYDQQPSNPGESRPRSLSDERLIALPARSWEYSLRFVSNWKYSIVIAHRESIRKLSEKRLGTPYCCYAQFTYRKTSECWQADLEPSIVSLRSLYGESLSLEPLPSNDGTEEEKSR